MSKKGIGQWVLIISLMLIISGTVLFISSKMFYAKAEVNNLLDKASCMYISIEPNYFGQTPIQVCELWDKKVKFLFVREVVNVLSPEGNNIYDDENFIVDNSLLNTPLGMAEDLQREYGHPGGYMGDINKYTQGLLCCG